MEVKYDVEADAASIFFTAPLPGISKESIPVDINGHAFSFDFNEKGELVSIEIIDASRVIPISTLNSYLSKL